MATAQVCPVVGTTTSVLPPNHPSYDPNVAGQKCPVTNATTDHHHEIHNHPAATEIPSDQSKSMDASACPAVKSMQKNEPLVDATCPVVGPVSAVLPPNHPDPSQAKAGDVCPVTNATLEHHKTNVHLHPPVKADAGVCPVAGKSAEALK